jgi:hypothetical protein
MRQITCAAAAVLMATAFGCSPRDRQETASKVDSVAEDVREETREGAEEVREEAREVRDYSYAERNEFRHDVALQLENLDEKIAEVERDTKRGVDHARDSAIVDLRAARRAVSRDLDRLSTATESNWDDAKRNLKDSLAALHREVHGLLPDARPMGGTGPK